MKYATIVTLCLILVAGFGCTPKQQTPPSEIDKAAVIDRPAILLEAKRSGLIMNDEEILRMTDPNLQEKSDGAAAQNLSTQKTDTWKSAALADVTTGGSFGLAHATFQNGSYLLVSKMGNLPEPQNGFFYEGWIVRRGDVMRVMSLGRAQLVENQYVITFRSRVDLSDHDFFVLTLEPSDNNPVPAEHILEGMFR
ncbi:MAG: anti-sigma factor [Patescibacteria group bacterium]